MTRYPFSMGVHSLIQRSENILSITMSQIHCGKPFMWASLLQCLYLSTATIVNHLGFRAQYHLSIKNIPWGAHFIQSSICSSLKDPICPFDIPLALFHTIHNISLYFSTPVTLAQYYPSTCLVQTLSLLHGSLPLVGKIFPRCLIGQPSPPSSLGSNGSFSMDLESLPLFNLLYGHIRFLSSATSLHGVVPF